MTDDSSRPIAGWYPDPDEPETHRRYWDGFAWQVRKPLVPDVLPASSYGRMTDPQFLPPWLPVPLRPGFGRLGLVVRAAIRVSIAVSVAQIALYTWGRSMFVEAIEMGDIDRLDRYDDVDLWLSIGLVVSLLVAGVGWMVWQFKLARATHPDALRRSPNWHAWAWIVPIVSFWFPFQNVKDLWARYVPGASTVLLGWWWAFFIGTQLMFNVYDEAYENADTLDGLETATLVGTGSAVISIIGAVLALKVHRALEDGALRPGAAPVV